MFVFFTHLKQGFLHFTVNPQIDHGVGERAPHVIFHGEVIHTLQGGVCVLEEGGGGGDGI